MSQNTVFLALQNTVFSLHTVDFVFETIYFSNIAAHQGIYENSDALHQHLWLVKTKLLQLVPL